MQGRQITAAALGVALALHGAKAAQEDLPIDVTPLDPILRFDWPDIQVGIGSYEAGPTGLTIIRFTHKVAVVSDARGGAPGTVNTEAFGLGYDMPRMDAIVFSGGSNYGEEAVTATMTGLKDDGVRSGVWNNMARATGAVIYDFGNRRLNDVYPDKRLARAALHALTPGSFPLGAQGAGRMAMQGGFFACNAHSGQGAAFREVDGVKIAAFVVVNATGSVVNRQGNVVSCHPAASWHGQPKIAELMANLPNSRSSGWDPGAPTQRNTTLSLIVTNQKLDYAGLRRLAVQVHTSMARAIQPFSTFDDGDVLFAASTDEVAAPVNYSATTLSPNNLNTIAGETMWDAILASVPQDPDFTPSPVATLTLDQMHGLTGIYEFGPQRRVQVTEEGGTLRVLALNRPVFEFDAGKPVPIVPISDTEFYVDERYHTRLSFARGPDGKVTAVTLNPGQWSQIGKRLPG